MNLSEETVPEYQDFLKIPTIDVLYGTAALLSCFFGSISNIFSVKYFAKNRHKVSCNVYLWMVAVDFLTCFSMIHFGLSRIRPGFGNFLGKGIWCNILGFIYNISSRLSVFIVAVQSIIRSYSLVYPFKKVQVGIPMVILSTMAVIQILQASLPYVRGKGYEYNDMWGICLWYLEDILSPSSSLYYMLYILTLILPFLLPALPVLVSCGVSIKYIWNTNPSPAVLSETPKISQLACVVKNKLKRRASVTVVIITVVYIVFNMPYWIYLICNMILDEPLGGNLFNTYFGILLNPLCVILNAAANPIIYYFRIADMKNHVLLAFRNVEFPRSLKITKIQTTIVHTPMRIEDVHFDTPFSDYAKKLRLGSDEMNNKDLVVQNIPPFCFFT